MTAVGMGRNVSVYEMLQTIGRAKVATMRGSSAETITNWLRTLDNEALIVEYHAAVAVLLAKGLLTPKERGDVRDYARDWIDSQPMSGQEL